MGSSSKEAVDAASQNGAEQPDNGSKSKRNTKESLLSFFQLLFYANPTWVDYLLIVVGTLAACGSGVPFPLMGILFGDLLDDLNRAGCEAGVDLSAAKEVQESVNDKVLVLFYLGLGIFALIYIYVVSWNIFSRRVERRIRDRYFQMLLRQDASFFDTRQSGELSSRLNADIQAVQSGTSEKVGMVMACVSFFVTAYVVSFTRNWRLASILISLIPAFLIMAAVGSAFTQRFTMAVSDATGAASSIAQETLSNIAVVQAFSAGPRLERRFSARMLEAQKNGIKKAFAAALQAGTLYFIGLSANALAYWQGSKQIAASYDADNSGTTVGHIYTVIFLLVDACIILGSIAPVLPILGAGAAAFRKLREDMERPSGIDPTDESGTRLPAPIQGSVSFQGVSFAYRSRPDRPVLDNVSFECPAGKYTALVGLSGSGKSTVAGLTARLYDPTQGTICLDGHDLRDINVRNLRSFMSLVQQEPSLLDRSILENIALGLVNSPQADHQRFQPILLTPVLADVAKKVRDGEDLASCAQSYGKDVADIVEHVRHAASLADASVFVENLENGYGTLVGTGGKLVSGGQRQRLALARALVRDPQILILDEATASLDSQSEQRIQRAVESISKDRTLISIAHRLSTIKNADNIIVMSQGRVLEQGTHFELMALNGSYAGMVRLQNINKEENEETPSLSSTSRGDTEVVISEKDSMKDDRPQTADQAPDKAPEQHDESATPDAPEETGDPADSLDAHKPLWTVIKSVGRMVRPNVLFLIAAAVAATIVGVNFSASGLVFGNTVGGFSPCNTKAHVLWVGRFFGGIFFMLATVQLISYTVSWSGFGYVAEKLLFKLRVLSFRSLYEQELEWHQTGGRTATSLLSIITADTAAVGSFSGSIMGTIFSICISFIVAVTLSHITAWKIAIVCLVTVPILLGAGAMQFRSLARYQKKHAGAFKTALGITVEAVNSFKTISTLSLEEEVMASYSRALQGPRKDMILSSVYTNLFLAIAASAAPLIYAFAYWWGSTRITSGEYTQTQFFIILVAMLVSAQLWGQMFTLAPEISRARSAASRILSLLDMGSSESSSVKEDDLADGGSSSQGEKDVEAEGGALVVPPTAGNRGCTVTFKNVGFAYPARPHIPILRDMSFTIQSGQFCGLVGPSGAGKSTIMSLVQRMYSPASGTVEMDGVDICAREGVDFRDEVAVVPQDCALFEGTIKFNVGLGARKGREATDAEIEEACKLANIHDTIVSLPDKYETECGPNGSRLSGGQRQRLAIARALVRKPRLLLLDESTSALDAESEKALQEGLEQAARGITVIAITHRLHTVRKADVIFVVEGGRVVEKGRHEELVETSESYRVNALQQMLGD